MVLFCWIICLLTKIKYQQFLFFITSTVQLGGHGSILKDIFFYLPKSGINDLFSSWVDVGVEDR